MKLRPIIPYAILILFCTLACVKDDLSRISLSNWKPEIALPLIHSSLKTADFIKKFETGGYLTEDSINNVVIVYENDFESPTASALFPIDDISLDFINNSANISILLNEDAILSQLWLEEGLLQFDFSAKVQEDVLLVFSSPQAVLNQEGFVSEIMVPYEGGSGLSLSSEIDLTDLLISFPQDEKNRNTFQLTCEAFTAENGTEVPHFDINAILADLAFSLMTGYLGAMEFGHHSSTMKLDIFDNWISGTIFFDDPKIKINSWNGFGLPIHLSMDNLQGTNNQSAAMPFSGSLTNEATPLNYPDSTQIGAETKTLIIADTSNSNLVNLLAISPHQIDYELSMITNIHGNTGEKNFMTADARTRFHIEMDIPLKGRIDHLIYQDTFSLDLGNISLLDSAAFKLDALNTFPVSAAIQVYFTTEDFRVTDSLLSPPRNIISAGNTDQSGQVITPTSETNFIPLGKEKIELLQNSRHMIFKIILLTDGGGMKTVRFTTDNALEIKLGVLSQINLL